MTGIATKFTALSVLEKSLLASGDDELIKLGDLISTHSEYAHFGSLGDSIGDFSPVNVESVTNIGAPGANPYVGIWKLIFDVFGGDGTPDNPGLKPLLDRIRGLLSQLDIITAAEDLSALQELEGEVETINQISSDLTTVIAKIKGDGTLGDLGMVPLFQQFISDINKPAIVKPRADGKVGFPEQFWTLREFLSWRRSGDFAKELWTKAFESDSDELKAYALGWISTWSLNAGGGSAIASIVGAPYRNQWWRTRFVSNYIDLWAQGFYETEASMTGDTPTPGYDTWPNLCDKELHKKIELPGVVFSPEEVMEKLRLSEALPANLPDQFVEYWISAYEKVYDDFGGLKPKVTPDTMQDAYAMSWLVIWFQTSKESLGCHAMMPVNFDFCNEAPAWTNPANQPGGGAGGGLPAPTINPTIDAGAVGCAIFLLILGIVLIFQGGFVAGGIAIGAAIVQAVNAGTIDWNTLKCDLGWYKVYLYNALRALHDLLSLGAFVHPYTHELSTDTTVLELLQGFNTELRTGVNILKTKERKAGYPLLPWDGNGFWFDSPGGGFEKIETIPAIGTAYASGFINDPTNPLGVQSTFKDITWPFNADDKGRPLGYKNSIDSLLDWFKSEDGKIPNVNLDGDRGLGYGEWVFEGGEWTDPVNIKQP